MYLKNININIFYKLKIKIAQQVKLMKDLSNIFIKNSNDLKILTSSKL